MIGCVPITWFTFFSFACLPFLNSCQCPCCHWETKKLVPLVVDVSGLTIQSKFILVAVLLETMDYFCLWSHSKLKQNMIVWNNPWLHITCESAYMFVYMIFFCYLINVILHLVHVYVCIYVIYVYMYVFVYIYISRSDSNIVLWSLYWAGLHWPKGSFCGRLILWTVRKKLLSLPIIAFLLLLSTLEP